MGLSCFTKPLDWAWGPDPNTDVVDDARRQMMQSVSQ